RRTCGTTTARLRRRVRPYGAHESEMSDLARVPQATGECLVESNVHRAMFLKREISCTGADTEHAEAVQIALDLACCIHRRRGEAHRIHVVNELLNQLTTGRTSHRDDLRERATRQCDHGVEVVIVEQLTEECGSDGPGASQNDRCALTSHGRTRIHVSYYGDRPLCPGSMPEPDCAKCGQLGPQARSLRSVNSHFLR